MTSWFGRFLLAACFGLLAVPCGPSGNTAAAERTAESREKLARAERVVAEFLDSVRKLRAVKTMEEWQPAYQNMDDLKMRFRELAGKGGDEAFEAFETAVLNGAEEWDRLSLLDAWSGYLSAAVLDQPAVGRGRVNRFLQNPKLTMRLKAEILQGLPASSQPAEWLDEHVMLGEIRRLLESTKEFCKSGAGSSAPDAGGAPKVFSIRYCDLGLEFSYWYLPAGAARLDFAKTAIPERDQAVTWTKKWLEARLRLLDLRRSLFAFIRDYRLLEPDRDQLSTAFALWAKLDRRETVANFRDLKSLSEALLAEMKDRRDTGRTVVELDRQFQREIVRALQELFKAAGHGLRAPNGNEMDVPGATLLWLRDAATEASKNAKTPFQRQEWNLFANGF